MDQKAKINLVHVTGLGRTKDLVAAKIIEKVFNSKTLRDVVYNASLSREQLLSLGLKSVVFELDTAKGPDTSDHDFDLKFDIREARRLAGGLHTTFGNKNDGKASLQFTLPNTLGAGECVSLGYQRGMDKKDSSVSLEFMKPLAPWSLHAPKLSFTAYQTQQSIKISSFDQTDRGADIDFLYKLRKNLAHKISLQYVWRQIDPLERETPIKIREEAGHSLKSSIKSVLTYDCRNDKVFASRGGLARLIQEYAGLFGNVGFYKQEIELNHFQRLPFFRSLVLQSSITSGLLVKLEDRVVCINDKFFLGGPLNLRGFKHFGIGPQSLSRPLGGSAMWLAGLHLNCPLPLIQAKWSERFRVHLFANAGNIVDNEANNVNMFDYKMLNELTTNIRMTYGVGLIMRIGEAAKVELNYVLPLRSQDSDLVDYGIQCGIGFTF